MLKIFTIYFFLLILSTTTHVVAQSDSSTINRVRLVGRVESLQFVQGPEPKLEIQLKMSLSNISNHEVLFLGRNGDSEMLEIRGVSILSDQKSKPIYKDFQSESYGKSQYFQDLAKAIDTRSPDAKFIRRLPVGETIELEPTVVVWLKKEDSMGSEFPPKPTIKELLRFIDLKLYLVCGTWSKNLDLNSDAKDFQKLLRKRWYREGYLYTENIVSEAISLNLSLVKMSNGKK